MGFGSNSERSSKTGREKVQLSHADLRLKNQGKLNVKNGVTFSYSDLPGKIGNNQFESTSVETKASRDCKGQPLKGKLTKEDELVRYMSNLPGYLQRVDSSDNLQEKALNFGVLDWGRLEKWKSHQKRIPTINGNDVSSTSTILASKTDVRPRSAFSSSVPKVASASRSKQHSSTCSSLASSQKDGIPRGAKSSTPKVRHYQEIETASKKTLDQQKKSSKTYKSFGKSYSDVILDKGKKNELDQKITSEMGNMSSNIRNHGVSPLPKETASVCDVRVENRVEQRQETDVNKKDLDQKNTSSMKASSSKSRFYAGSLESSKTLSAETDKTKNNEAEESKIDLTHECSPGEHKNIVLLLPKSARNSFFEEPREGNLNEARQRSFSCDPLQKDRFRELRSEVPHSCKFPSGVEMNSETDMMARGLEPSSDASEFSNHTGNIRCHGKHSAENKTKFQDADADTLKILEEEMAELATERSRTSSPSRRFSFSLSRLSRSFSFKESSAVPQLNSDYVSVRSGPVRSESSGFLDDANREKLNGHNSTRSSPFRRVLDPLLKSKGLNSFRSTDTVQPSKGSSNSSIPRRVNTNESFQEEKLGPSMINALLEVAMKNGLPLFRFVVNNGSSMLATTMKSLASSDKGGTDQNYVFSSVNEIKKKSGSWISKGNKEKNCGYIYNIIGQMKISNSHFSDLTVEDSCNHYLVREFVLFSVEQRQADEASAKFTQSTELAAVVTKIPGEKNVQHGDKDILRNGFSESLAMDGCTCNSMENPSSNSTTVIIPGGVHTLPNKGIPSPLIDRWRIGGLCDCGGWDVGCKLHILSNQNCKCCKNSACLDPNRFELYPQGEAQQNMPIFSLVPYKKGIYAIEFSSSITALQAFFISVTVISCKKSSDLPEFGNLPEGKVIKETMFNGSLAMDNKPTIILGTMPAKYAPNPPHSPVGRV